MHFISFAEIEGKEIHIKAITSIVSNRGFEKSVVFSLRISDMRLVITENYDAMAEWGARYIKKRINDFKPGPDRYFVLGLPTGMFVYLIRIIVHQENTIEFVSRQYTFGNVQEINSICKHRSIVF